MQQCGFTKNEALVYTTLTRTGPSSAGHIIKGASIASSRVYASLTTLRKRGLISSFKKNNKTFFVAENPDRVLEQFDETRQRLQPFLEQLKCQEKKTEKLFENRIFEGHAGFKSAFHLLLDECNPHDEILTLGFSSRRSSLESLRAFLKNIDRKRIAKQVSMRMILSQDMKATLGKDREREQYVAVRYMPIGYMSPCAINVFNDFVYLELWEDEPVVFMIRNKDVANSFRSYFDFLWTLGKNK